MACGREWERERCDGEEEMTEGSDSELFPIESESPHHLDSQSIVFHLV
jgi:hypothetical protein